MVGNPGPAASKPLPIGKLPAELLEIILQSTLVRDPDVLVGPGIGLDCAVVEIGDRILVLKSDPITFVAENIGWYAVQVNANDIATTGAKPRWMIATLLLPENQTTSQLVLGIQEQIINACNAIGVTIIGGHTEITHHLDRPIITGTMIGEVNREQLIIPSGARPGDQILITKSVPIEATAILAKEFKDVILAREPSLNLEEIRAASHYLYEPGISVLEDAQIAIAAGCVHAMHDPTEGGLYNAAWELAQASGCSLWIDPDLVPITSLSSRICSAMKIDPLGAISSGALLLVVAEEEAPEICSALANQGIPCTCIGKVIDRSPEPKVFQDPKTQAVLLPRADRDEIARLFDEQ